MNSDLRPISLTAVLNKVLAGFLFSWLAPILMPHIDHFQFGGVKKSSTRHTLVYLIHQWGAYATGRLEDSGRLSDEKMWRELRIPNLTRHFSFQ